MDDSKKRSRVERELLHQKINDLLVDMLDAKQVAATLNITAGYTYQRIKDMGYRRCFITAEEREQIRRQRVERRATKVVI